MKKFSFLLAIAGGFLICSFAPAGSVKQKQPVYQDVPYQQEYAIKYYFQSDTLKPLKVGMDRNLDVKVLTTSGLYKPYGGQFLYPGTLEKDRSYRPIGLKKLTDMLVTDNQFVYLDDKAVLSNAWAGKLFSKHGLESATGVEAGTEFHFLVHNGKEIRLVDANAVLWQGVFPGDKILAVHYDATRKAYWLLGRDQLCLLDPAQKNLKVVFKGENMTSFDLSADKNQIFIGTTEGYIRYNPVAGKQEGDLVKRVPCQVITSVAQIHGKIWFGSVEGAFQLREDGKYNFYNGERWIPGNKVIGFAPGEKDAVLILTDKGYTQLVYKAWTLAEKAEYYEKQQRLRHIRNGFNSSYDDMTKGDLASGRLTDSDNDGLWTSMYLAGEVFRYAVTKSPDALQNCRESLEAMERLYSINGLKGFPSRSFERSGWMKHLSDPDRWKNSADTEWDWKATTSSDEAIGHIFVMGAMAELMGDQDLSKRAVHLIDILMQHIVDHDMYLVDFDGKPT
ncbi:MAG: hypothetical protein LWW85_05755, partial [Marinilabiliales bacterium]|nr:hypothetical protein [Marinilabiliales bacterium]